MRICLITIYTMYCMIGRWPHFRYNKITFTIYFHIHMKRHMTYVPTSLSFSDSYWCIFIIKLSDNFILDGSELILILFINPQNRFTIVSNTYLIANSKGITNTILYSMPFIIQALKCIVNFLVCYQHTQTPIQARYKFYVCYRSLRMLHS